MSAHPALIDHSSEFTKDVIELAPGVYTAVGYAASNVHMLVGGDGVVIIDTTETTRAAENIWAEFRKITDRPVAAIVYTHSHRDHISGASVFAEGGAPDILASSLFASDLVSLDPDTPAPNTALMDRTRHQFGMGLPFPDERVNLGCGPGDRPMEGMGAGFLPPTRRIDPPGTPMTVCGLDIELIHAPGETADHMAVWLRDEGVLFCGDNYYKSFPNLYAIRGTPFRDFDAWVRSLETLLQLDAEILSPGHSRPVIGAEAVREVLTDYRDAIAHVIRATAEGMNAGLTPDELAHTVALPDHLASKPHLQEFYGKVSWAVRAYFTGTLGWFDGNPTNLARPAPAERAERLIELAGGPKQFLNAMQQAVNGGEWQWAMELCDHLIAADTHVLYARTQKAACLRALADTEINATARNYYLVAAKDLDG